MCSNNHKENSNNSNNEADHVMLDENDLPEKSGIKDDFFDKLLNDIEESIKDM